jgi:hypothetical protein
MPSPVIPSARYIRASWRSTSSGGTSVNRMLSSDRCASDVGSQAGASASTGSMVTSAR